MAPSVGSTGSEAASQTVDIDDLPFRFQISTYYTSVHRSSENGESVFTSEKLRSESELLASVCAWNHECHDRTHRDNRRHLWPMSESKEFVKLHAAFTRLILLIRERLPHKFTGDWSNWNDLLQHCPSVMEIAVNAYNRDPGYSAKKAGMALHYHVRMGDLSLTLDEMPVQVEGDRCHGGLQFGEVWIRFRRMAKAHTLQMTVWGTRVRQSWHLPSIVDSPLFANGDDGQAQIKRFRTIVLEADDLTGEFKPAWNNLFLKHKIVQNIDGNTYRQNGCAHESNQPDVAVDAGGEEPEIEKTRVRMRRHQVFRLPRARQSDNGENADPQCTIVSNFGFSRIVTVYKYRDADEQCQVASKILLEYLKGDDPEDDDHYQQCTVTLAPKDTVQTKDLHVAIQNQAGQHFSCRQMWPEEFASIYNKLYRDYLQTGGQVHKMITMFGAQADSIDDLDQDQVDFVFENCCVSYKHGYRLPVLDLDQAGYVLERTQFRRITTSGMSVSGFPRLRCRDWHAFVGMDHTQRTNRMQLFRSYFDTTARFYGGENGPGVLWTQCMVWAGLSFLEWHSIDKCFPITYLLSTQGNVGKTTALYAMCSSLGLSQQSLAGNSTSISGFLSQLNAMSGLMFIVDDFQSELTNNNASRSAQSTWKEIFKGVHDANCTTQHNRVRLTRSCALVSANMELHSHDEPLQTRLFTVEFMQPPDQMAVDPEEYEEVYKDISCLLPDVLGMKWDGKLDNVFIQEVQKFIMVFTNHLKIPSRVAKHLKKSMYYMLLVSRTLRGCRNPRNSLDPAVNQLSHEAWENQFLTRWYDQNVFGYMVNVQLRRYWNYVAQKDMWKKFIGILARVDLCCDRNSKMSLHHHNMVTVRRNADGGSLVTGEGVEFCAVVLADALKVCKHHCSNECAHMVYEHLSTVQPRWLKIAPFFFGSEKFWSGGLPITRTVTEGEGETRTSSVTLLHWDDVEDALKTQKPCCFFPKHLLSSVTEGHRDFAAELGGLDWKTISIDTIRDGNHMAVNLYNEVLNDTWPGKRVYPWEVEMYSSDEEDEADEDDDDDDDNSRNETGNSQKRAKTTNEQTSGENFNVFNAMHDVLMQDQQAETQRMQNMAPAEDSDSHTSSDATVDENLENESNEEYEEVQQNPFVDDQAVDSADENLLS